MTRSAGALRRSLQRIACNGNGLGLTCRRWLRSWFLKRLREDRGTLFDDVCHREDIPSRTDHGPLQNYKTHRHTIYGRQEGHCNGCLVMFPFRNMTVDHIVPQMKGGSDHQDNLQLLCGACNSAKGTGSQEALVAKLKADGLRQ